MARGSVRICVRACPCALPPVLHWGCARSFIVIHLDSPEPHLQDFLAIKMLLGKYFAPCGSKVSLDEQAEAVSSLSDAVVAQVSVGTTLKTAAKSGGGMCAFVSALNLHTHKVREWVRECVSE